MNDDGIALNVLNAIVHAVLALPGGSDTMKASFPQFVNALWFGAIGLDPFLGIAHSRYPVTNGPVGQGFFIQFIKYPNGLFFLADKPTEKRRWVIGITKVKAKGGFHTNLGAYFLHIEGFFPPVLKDQAIHNAPTTKASHFIAPGVGFLHSLENLQISFIQPFITQVIGGGCENLTIRGNPAIMEFVNGVPLGILAGDFSKEPFPDPMACISNQKKLGPQSIVFKFSELEEYRIEKVGEKTVTKTKGGITRAVVGGAAFGLAGAIVGASTAKQETVKKGGVPILYLDLNFGEVKTTVSISNPPFKATEFLNNIIDEQ